VGLGLLAVAVDEVSASDGAAMGDATADCGVDDEVDDEVDEAAAGTTADGDRDRLRRAAGADITGADRTTASGGTGGNAARQSWASGGVGGVGGVGGGGGDATRFALGAAFLASFLA
jgi:hypothetical protein